MRKQFFLLFVFLLSATMVVFSSCSRDDDDDVKVKVEVSIRVDLNVPEYVEVFGQKVQLNNEDTWKVTIESFRTHEFTISVPESRVPKKIDSPLKSDDPRLKGVFEIIPSRYNTTKNVFTVQNTNEGNHFIFVITP